VHTAWDSVTVVALTRVYLRAMYSGFGTVKGHLVSRTCRGDVGFNWGSRSCSFLRFGALYVIRPVHQEVGLGWEGRSWESVRKTADRKKSPVKIPQREDVPHLFLFYTKCGRLMLHGGTLLGRAGSHW